MAAETHPLLEGMNPQQAAAITCPDGPALVLAGPGSGKTAVLTRRIAWLIRERAVPHHRILAVTFTNKATDEMRTRLEAMLGDNLDRMQIGTFHRIFARLLRRDSHLLGYRPDWSILQTSRQYWVIRHILEGIGHKDASSIASSVRRAISRAKNRLVLPHNLEATDDFLATARRVYQIYQAHLLEENLMDVDDLLLQFAILLKRFPPARYAFQHGFDYVLIDEFQDTNLAQYEIVKMLAPPQYNIFVVGDEDQSIYAFRGANYQNLQRLRDDFPSLRQFLLEQNYRSTQTIVAAARAVISHNPHRSPKALFSKSGVGNCIQIYEASSDLDEAEYVRKQIQCLRRRMRLQYGEFAIMYRKNTQSLPLKSVLHRHNVPFRVVNAINFGGRREVLDIMAMLRLAYDSDEPEFLKRIAGIRAFGISKNGMDKFLDWSASEGMALINALDMAESGASPLHLRQAMAFAGFARVLKLWRSAASRGSLLCLFNQIMRDSDYDRQLERACKEDWELAERENSVRRLRELAGIAARSSKPFERFIDLVAMEQGDFHRDSDKVALTTLHSAKGLEFPVVFIIGLNHSILPHVHDVDGPNDVTEERRLFYVGITRAESRLFLSYSSQKGLSDKMLSPSEFLFELPDDLVEAG